MQFKKKIILLYLIINYNIEYGGIFTERSIDKINQI